MAASGAATQFRAMQLGPIVQCWTGTHVSVLAQSAGPVHSVEGDMLNAPVCTQAFRWSQGPIALQSPSTAQVSGTSGCSSGKYFNATLKPAEFASLKKPLMALFRSS